MSNISSLINTLPGSSVEKLFDIVLDDRKENMWSEIADIILRKFPIDIIVVNQLQHVTLYSRTPEGIVTSRSDAAIYNLRAPELYNKFNLGFSESVRSFEGVTLNAAVATHRNHLKHIRYLHAISYDLLDGEYICASIIIYGPLEIKSERLSFFNMLSPVLKKIFERNTVQSQKSITHAGLTQALKYVPYGILIMNWALGDKIINNEGLLKCLQWNEGRDSLPSSLKIAKQRFSIPAEIQQGLDELRRLWLENEHGLKIASESKNIICGLNPQLSCTVSILNLTDSPLELPCFMVHFSAASTRFEILGSEDKEHSRLVLMSKLTPSERTVLLLLIEGKKNSEIAIVLHRQESTIKEHLTSIYSKLEMRRNEIIRFFCR